MGAGEWIKRVDFWMLGIAAFLVTRLLLPTSTLSRETLLKARHLLGTRNLSPTKEGEKTAAALSCTELR